MPFKNIFKHLTYQLFSPETVVKEKYAAFKILLTRDKAAHDHLAALESLFYNNKKYDFQAVVQTYDQFTQAVSDMVAALLKMCPTRYRDLAAYHRKFDFYVRFMLAPPAHDTSSPFTLPLAKAAAADESLVGKKAFILSLAARDLHLPVPRGFVITTNAFHRFMAVNDLDGFIHDQLARLDIEDAESLWETSAAIEQRIENAVLPDDIRQCMTEALERLGQNHEKHSGLALRSSAVGEDGKASFAGQYRTLLNISQRTIARGYKKIIAGKYTPRALFYRINRGIPDSETPMAVLVLEMVDSRNAGVVYTRNPAAPANDRLLIHSVWGQGAHLVDGDVSPDVVTVSRPFPHRILHISTGAQKNQMILDPDTRTRATAVSSHQQKHLSLSTPAIHTLARWSMMLEDKFKAPQDMEWCCNQEGELYLLQARPLHLPTVKTPVSPEKKRIDRSPGESVAGNASEKETDNSSSPTVQTKTAPPTDTHECLCAGAETVCPGRAWGTVYRHDQLTRLPSLPPGSILVLRHARPRFATALHQLAAVVVQSGSRAGHFASVAREFEIPAIVNIQDGFDSLVHGEIVTVDATAGRIYKGKIPSLQNWKQIKEVKSSTADGFEQSPFMKKLKFVMDFSARLKLTDPMSPDFTPQGCRSLHDIVRFAHETAVNEMFRMGTRKGQRKKGARKLTLPIPMCIYLLDVGGGITGGPKTEKTLTMDDITSMPMQAVLQGLLTPGINWSHATHFDWEAHDRIVLSGGIISPDSPRFNSYAVVSEAYVNINFRFGYHFVILDAFTTRTSRDNYILFRFSGGGGDHTGRILRAAFLQKILTRLGFMVSVQSDLVDAEFKHGSLEEMVSVLKTTGILLGVSKLMDMYLKDAPDIDLLVDDFMAGRYDFCPADEAGEA